LTRQGYIAPVEFMNYPFYTEMLGEYRIVRQICFSREVRMTSAALFKDSLMSTYEARARDNLEGTLAAFADDVVFEINGRGTGAPSLASPIHGKNALRPVMRELIESYKLSKWRAVSFLADGDKAALHWRGLVTFPASGKSAEFDVFDFMTFRDGKISAFHQATDTALLMAMAAP
jgi:ketosteroid isomerase-like protein